MRTICRATRGSGLQRKPALHMTLQPSHRGGLQRQLRRARVPPALHVFLHLTCQLERVLGLSLPGQHMPSWISCSLLARPAPMRLPFHHLFLCASCGHPPCDGTMGVHGHESNRSSAPSSRTAGLSATAEQSWRAIFGRRCCACPVTATSSASILFPSASDAFTVKRFHA